MRIIALATQKGGSGKTTLAASIAVAASIAGETVFAIDLDPQESLTKWGTRRVRNGLLEISVDKTTPDQLKLALQGVKRSGYTLVIIDTAGVDSPSTAAAMQVADLTLIPARPSMFDIEAARPTVAALLRLERPFAFVINQAPSGRSSRSNDASKALSLFGGDLVAEPFIVQRADHMDAIAMGKGVAEHDPHGKAAEEISKLFDWIKRRIGNSYG